MQYLENQSQVPFQAFKILSNLLQFYLNFNFYRF